MKSLCLFCQQYEQADERLVNYAGIFYHWVLTGPDTAEAIICSDQGNHVWEKSSSQERNQG